MTRLTCLLGLHLWSPWEWISGAALQNKTDDKRTLGHFVGRYCQRPTCLKAQLGFLRPTPQ